MTSGEIVSVGEEAGNGYTARADDETFYASVPWLATVD